MIAAVSKTVFKALVLSAWVGISSLVICAAAWSKTPDEVNKELRELPWQAGPSTAAVSNKASMKIEKGAAFLDQANSGKFLELNGNLPSSQYNILATEDWFAAFSFDDSGFIKDDETIDADKLLKQLKDGDEEQNEERKKRGLSEIHTEGWFVAPHYDSATKRLEWGLRLRSENQVIVNYTVRLLARKGYESATLVSSPDRLAEDVKTFKTALQGFEFNSGERYSEFRQGDRIAEFGLAALVAGGAAAVAAKTGLWKVIVGFLAAFWKVIAGGAVALSAGIGKFFRKKQ